MNPYSTDPLKKRYMVVSIDEIQQTFVSTSEFAGRFAATVTLSNGTTRNIELTAMVREGIPVVQFKDTGHVSYMGPNGTTTNGRLRVTIRDLEQLDEEREQWRRHFQEWTKSRAITAVA